MTCASCKGTRQIVLLYSTVACEDCGPTVYVTPPGLAAAPMLKFRVGDRVRTTLGSEVRGTFAGMADEFSGDPKDRVLAVICAPGLHGMLGANLWTCEPEYLEREDTI